MVARNKSNKKTIRPVTKVEASESAAKSRIDEYLIKTEVIEFDIVSLLKILGSEDNEPVGKMTLYGADFVKVVSLEELSFSIKLEKDGRVVSPVELVRD